MRTDQARPVFERFWEKVEIPDPEGCWLWIGNKFRVRNQPKKTGYGIISIGSRADGSKRNALAHRLSYEMLRGTIPSGMCIDHRVCRNKSCVNPWHMVVCTRAENTAQPDAGGVFNKAKTHCKRGHELSPENTRYWRGARACRTCILTSQRRFYQKRRLNSQ